MNRIVRFLSGVCIMMGIFAGGFIPARAHSQEKALGKQLLIELYGCDTLLINDAKVIENVLLEAARLAGATIITHTFHTFSPQGVSGVVVVAESHLAIHTWPEAGYCAIDIFTCGDLTDNHKAFAYIAQSLKAASSSLTELRRGILPALITAS